ncbi:hypothetical protein [Streptomyces sp. CS227]|uniref:hypothetical protein n=1 Tax=Streptomyces sp. CS227 TaxID=1982763 RepID=UPI0015C5B3EA|nr:hypothetical protein [Streptomyces sp. CS227]
MDHRRPGAGPDLPGDHRQRAAPAQVAPVEAAGKKVSSCVKTATNTKGFGTWKATVKC